MIGFYGAVIIVSKQNDFIIESRFVYFFKVYAFKCFIF